MNKQGRHTVLLSPECWSFHQHSDLVVVLAKIFSTSVIGHLRGQYVKSTSVSLAQLRPMSSPPFAKAMCSYFITSSFASSHLWLPGLMHSPFSFLSILLLTLKFRDVEGNHPWQGATLLEALILGKLESKPDSACPWDHQPNGLNHFHQLEAHELWWASSGTMAKYNFSTLCKICVLLTQKHIPTPKPCLTHTTNHSSPLRCDPISCSRCSVFMDLSSS